VVIGWKWGRRDMQFVFRKATACLLVLMSAGIAEGQIKVDKARIGCLDIQTDGNLTTMVQKSCDGMSSCTFKAPTPDEYKRAGVQARTRTFCTQAMEIIYHCGNGPTTVITVPGDAWNHPPAQLVCGPPPVSGGPPSQVRGIQNVSLVREQSSPAVFLIVGDTKFWIVDTTEFATLGFDWAKVRIVADGSLSRFTEGRLHAPPTTRPSDVFFDCPDLDWPAVWDGKHYGNCKPSAAIVRKDVLVAGWLKDDTKGMPYVNSGDPDTGGMPGVEDIHYNLALDAVFLDHIYGVGGLSTALSNAVWPGNPRAAVPMMFATDPPLVPGGAKIASFNAWILPCNSDQVHGELNAWHKDTVGGMFHRHWEGHGKPPAMWNSQIAQDTNAWFPFNPLDPGGTGRPLRNGDYVVMRGTIWEENNHSGCGANSPWSLPPTTGHDGITEMHPPDWLVRVRQPNPNARLTTFPIALASPVVTGSQLTGDHSIYPDFHPSSQTGKLQLRMFKRLVDSRFTNSASIVKLEEQPALDHLDVHVVVQPTGTQQARFKGAWLVGWSEVDVFDQVWIEDQVPTGAIFAGDNEGWNWEGDNVFSGKSAHRSALADGMHQHYFYGATNPIAVNYRDSLFATVFLDPDNPPNEVMLQWHTPTGWVRAYWGANLIDWGTDGTPDRRYIGPLPATGEWVRLGVGAAESLGIAGPVNVDGMAFTLFGGRATWDYAGVNRGGEVVQ